MAEKPDLWDLTSQEEKEAFQRACGLQPEESEAFMRDLHKIGFRMGVLGFGEDFLIENGFPDKALEIYLKSQNEAILKAAAEHFNLESPDGLRSPEGRTQEQADYIQWLAGAYTMGRLRKYTRSDYMKTQVVIENRALSIVKRQLHSDLTEEELAGVRFGFDDMEGREGETLRAALELLNCSFYATHGQFTPEESGFVGEAELDTIQDLTDQYLAFHVQSRKPYNESIRDFLAPLADKVTEITQSDYFSLPLPKAWALQSVIARAGSAGQLLNVGDKSLSGQVLIEASISDKDGNPLVIDDLHKGVQRAIGNLIEENHGQLPITVTPQQVYRAFARLPYSVNVTEQQAAEMEAALDVMMGSVSSIDFRQQLEKHKKIKQQPDYDYTSPEAGGLKGNLITAEKAFAVNKNGIREVAYIIFSYPMLYRYSRIVGQIAKVPNRLLTGGDKPAIRDSKTAGEKGRARDVAMRENVISRIYRMRERKKGKKRYSKLIRVEEVAQDCGFELTDKTRRTLLKNIGLFLADLQQQKEIVRYEETKEGRKIVGFTVQP